MLPHYGTISIHTFLAEGDGKLLCHRFGQAISIHTFLAEGDNLIRPAVTRPDISIHTFLAEGDIALSVHEYYCEISIHTFLAEGDFETVAGEILKENFNPHLPCGRRLQFWIIFRSV